VIRFFAIGLFFVTLMLALFASGVDALGLVPHDGAVLAPRLIGEGIVGWRLGVGTWLLEACGLVALFLLAQGRCLAWWLDGVIAGCLAWIFRGPLLVVTIVIAAGQPQAPWWRLAFGWLLLYVACGLVLAILARHSSMPHPRSERPWLPG